MRELVLIVLVLFARLGQAPAAFAEKRLALVIGVKAYKSLPVLANTIADAELIAEKLRAADFDVGIVRDPNNAALQEAARSFARKIEDAGRDTVALLYYAGHGVQNKKQVNYIIGADADLKADTDLPTQGFKIDQLLETLSRRKERFWFLTFLLCAIRVGSRSTACWALLLRYRQQSSSLSRLLFSSAASWPAMSSAHPLCGQTSSLPSSSCGWLCSAR